MAVNARVGTATQASPHEHVAAGGHPGAWIDIPQHQQVPLGGEVITGPQCAAMEAEAVIGLGRILGLVWIWLVCGCLIRWLDPACGKAEGVATHHRVDVLSLQATDRVTRCFEFAQQFQELTSAQGPVGADQIHRPRRKP
jgi:hypothetical protein